LSSSTSLLPNPLPHTHLNCLFLRLTQAIKGVLVMSLTVLLAQILTLSADISQNVHAESEVTEMSGFIV
jgi:hypothetical protein